MRLWLIIALQAMLMLGATLLYPDFQQPDEAAHVDYVLAHREGSWFDGPGQRHYQSGVLAAQAQLPDINTSVHVGGDQPVPRTMRRSFDALGTSPSTALLTNQMVQHPFLYYGLAAGFSYLLPDFSHRGFDVQIFWLRLLSLLLMLPVPILIFKAARWISADDNVALVAALVPLSIPSYIRTGASVTNDSLLVLTMTGLLALLVRAAWGDRTRRTALWVGVFWGAALLTKGFALVMPPVIVAAYVVGSPGCLYERLRSSWRPILISGGLGALIGGWWWVRNLVVYSVVQPDGYGTLTPALKIQAFGPTTPTGTELEYLRGFFGLLAVRIWGSVGLVDVPTLSHLLLGSITIVAIGLVVVSALSRGIVPGWRPSTVAVFCAPILLTVLIMYYGGHSDYRHGMRLTGLQVRYLVPCVLGFAVCAAVGLRRGVGRFYRWVPPALLTATLLWLGISSYLVLDVDMSPREPGQFDRVRDAAHFLADWAPWASGLTTAIVIGLGLTCLLGLAVFWRAAINKNGPESDLAPGA